MHIQQRLWSSAHGWRIENENEDRSTAQQSFELVFAFGDREELEHPERFQELRALYPDASIVTCSIATAGEILGPYVYGNTIAATAITYELDGRSAPEFYKDDPGELALLVSCVGRKLVLGERAEEEVEVVGRRLGDATTIAGFYSYGEISPLTNSPRCELHNQTMTITTLSER